MTEAELVEYLRIPGVSKDDDYGNVTANLKRTRGLPCIHICRQPQLDRSNTPATVSKKLRSLKR